MKEKLQYRVAERGELSGGIPGALGRWVSDLLCRIFAVDKANYTYNKLYSDDEFPRKIINDLGVEYTIDETDLANIPREGGLVIIANHPTGALEGLVMMDLITHLRPEKDFKFLSTLLLNRVVPLRKYIFLVDNFDGKERGMNVKAMKDAITHVRNGGVLAIFPAGEIATWQKGWHNPTDKEWGAATMKLIRKMNVPVLPIYIEAQNSKLFHRLGKIHPALRTAMIPRELFSKKGKCMQLNIGTPIPPRRLEELSQEDYNKFLRASVDLLKDSRSPEKGKAPTPLMPDGDVDLTGIVDMPSTEELKAELQRVEEYRLFTVNGQSMYCVPSKLIPAMMTAIGREREITFRQVGEGSMNACDTDKYDEYYHQMFLWDDSEERLIGGYRMGFGDEIVPRFGLDGFYTHSLFRYSDEMLPVLERGVELGRSFITRDYQRRPASLMMLWKGILYVMLKYRQFRYLIGPVTISGEFRAISKMLIVNHLRRHHYNSELARFVHPVTGLEGIHSNYDESLLDNIEDVDLVGKIVLDIEQGRRAIPVLIRKYLDMQSTVLGFNVDHDFCDALDALMILDMTHIPEQKINMLSKEITDIDVLARFSEINN